MMWDAGGCRWNEENAFSATIAHHEATWLYLFRDYVRVRRCDFGDVTRPVEQFDTNAGPVKITPINHASMMIEAGGKVIWVDL